MSSNTNNTGIMHASRKDGGPALCKNRRAFVTLAVPTFKMRITENAGDQGYKPCKRCAAKIGVTQ